MIVHISSTSHLVEKRNQIRVYFAALAINIYIYIRYYLPMLFTGFFRCIKVLDMCQRWNFVVLLLTQQMNTIFIVLYRNENVFFFGRLISKTVFVRRTDVQKRNIIVGWKRKGRRYLIGCWTIRVTNCLFFSVLHVCEK